MKEIPTFDFDDLTDEDYDKVLAILREGTLPTEIKKRKGIWAK